MKKRTKTKSKKLHINKINKKILTSLIGIGVVASSVAVPLALLRRDETNKKGAGSFAGSKTSNKRFISFAEYSELNDESKKTYVKEGNVYRKIATIASVMEDGLLNLSKQEIREVLVDPNTQGMIKMFLMSGSLSPEIQSLVEGILDKITDNVDEFVDIFDLLKNKGIANIDGKQVNTVWDIVKSFIKKDDSYDGVKETINALLANEDSSKKVMELFGFTKDEVDSIKDLDFDYLTQDVLKQKDINKINEWINEVVLKDDSLSYKQKERFQNIGKKSSYSRDDIDFISNKMDDSNELKSLLVEAKKHSYDVLSVSKILVKFDSIKDDEDDKKALKEISDVVSVEDVKKIASFGKAISFNEKMPDIYSLLLLIQPFFNNGLGDTLMKNQDVVNKIMGVLGVQLDTKYTNLIHKVLFEGFHQDALGDELFNIVNQMIDLSSVNVPIIDIKAFLKNVMGELAKVMMEPLSASYKLEDVVKKISDLKAKILEIRSATKSNQDLIDKIKKSIGENVANGHLLADAPFEKWNNFLTFYTSEIFPYVAGRNNVTLSYSNIDTDKNSKLQTVDLNKLLLLDDSELSKVISNAKIIKQYWDKDNNLLTEAHIKSLFNIYKDSLLRTFNDESIKKWNAFISQAFKENPYLYNWIDFNKLENLDQDEIKKFNYFVANQKLPQKSPDIYLTAFEGGPNKEYDNPLINGGDLDSKIFVYSSQSSTYYGELVTNWTDKVNEPFTISFKIGKVKGDLTRNTSVPTNEQIKEAAKEENLEPIAEISEIVANWTPETKDGEIIKRLETTSADGSNAVIEFTWVKNNDNSWSIRYSIYTRNIGGREDDIIAKIYDMKNSQVDAIVSNTDGKDIFESMQKTLFEYEASVETFKASFVEYFNSFLHELLKDNSEYNLALENQWKEIETLITKLNLSEYIDLNAVKLADKDTLYELIREIDNAYLKKNSNRAFWAINDDQGGTWWKVGYKGNIYNYLSPYLSKKIKGFDPKRIIELFKGIKVIPNANQKFTVNVNDLVSATGSIPRKAKDWRGRGGDFHEDDLDYYFNINSSKNIHQNAVMDFSKRDDPNYREVFKYKLNNKHYIYYKIYFVKQGNGTYTLVMEPFSEVKDGKEILATYSGDDDMLLHIAPVVRKIDGAEDYVKDASSLVKLLKDYYQHKNLLNESFDKVVINNGDDEEKIEKINEQINQQENIEKILKFEKERNITKETIKNNGMFNGKGLTSLSEDDLITFVTTISKMAIVLKDKIVDVASSASTGNWLLDLGKKILDAMDVIDDILDSIPEIDEFLEGDIFNKIKSIDARGIADALYKIFNLKLVGDDINKINSIYNAFSSLMKTLGLENNSTIEQIMNYWDSITTNDKKVILNVIQKGLDYKPNSLAEVQKMLTSILKVFKVDILDNDMVKSIIFGK